ncbi:MAG: efflux RND transporter periplasmic adaptor subunit [Candidatus Eiseniibacteriota bacterium]
MSTARFILAALCLCLAAASRAVAQPSPSPPASRAGFDGMLLPAQTALMKSKFDDRVAEVPQPLGARVRKDQLLLRFADDEYRVGVERAAAVLDRARSEFERARQLHEQAQSSKEEFERAETTLRLAKADHDLAVIRLRERSIVAPFDGILAERYVDPGASVGQGDPLLRVTSTSPLRVEVLLPESMLPVLRGRPMLKVTLASPDTVLWLPVRRVPALVDPASGMLPLQVAVDNARGRLTAGVSCRVEVLQGPRARR